MDDSKFYATGKVALLIGNSNYYENPNLPAALNDVKILAGILQVYILQSIKFYKTQKKIYCICIYIYAMKLIKYIHWLSISVYMTIKLLIFKPLTLDGFPLEHNTIKLLAIEPLTVETLSVIRKQKIYYFIN